MKKILSKLFVITFVLLNFSPLFLNQTSAEGENLIANPGMETADGNNDTAPQDWVQGGWGNNTLSYSYLTTGHAGNRSLKVELTTITDGDAKWYFTPVAVSGSTEYTYRNFYQSNVDSEIVYQVEDAEGTLSYYYLDSLPASTVGWVETAVHFTTPANAKKLTVFHLIYSVGWLAIDDASLAGDSTEILSPDPDGDSGNPEEPSANLVANSSVENASSPSSSLPQKWLQDRWGTNIASFSYLNSGHTGSRSIKVEITSRTDGDAKWYFSPITVDANTEYTFSDYYQSSVPTYLVAQIDNGSGIMQYLYIGEAAASPDSWQNFTGAFITPADAKLATVFHVVERAGWLITDDFSLTTKTVNTPLSTVNILNPLDGAVLKGAINIEANTIDQSGIGSIQFQLDGVNLGDLITEAPYIYSWDTTLTSNGSHTLRAIAISTNGVSTVSDAVVINVDNEIQISDPEPMGENLIVNSSFKNPDPVDNSKPQGWLEGGWGTNERAYEYLTVGHGDVASVKVAMNSYTDGDAKWYFTPIEVKPNTTYSFSNFYQSDVSTDLFSQVEDDNGNFTYQYLGSPAASADDWNQTAVSFVTPANAKRLTVFHLISRIGWLATDDFSLIEKEDSAAISGIVNPSMEDIDSQNTNLPFGWSNNSWGTSTVTFSYLSNGHSGNKSSKVEVTNYIDGDAKWLYTPYTTLTPGADYRFVDYYQSNVITRVVVMALASDGSAKYLELMKAEPAATWTKYSDTFTVPADTVKVVVFHLISQNGWLITDDYSVAPYYPQGFSRALVTLTFDDGWEDNCKSALPILKQYGFLSSQYYATTFIENPENPNEECRIQDFAEAGHEIGSHTVTHPFLTQLTDEELEYELSYSQTYLRTLIGIEQITGFASPYGDFDERVKAEIKKYYAYHRSVIAGYNSADNFDIYNIRVQNMTSTTTQAEFQEWLDRAAAERTWLVLLYHRVAEDPGQFDTATVDFKTQMEALYQSGLSVKTLSQALAEILPQI